MSNILSPEEAKARWICCPMCDRDTCNRNANDCDVKKHLEKEEKNEHSSTDHVHHMRYSHPSVHHQSI